MTGFGQFVFVLQQLLYYSIYLDSTVSGAYMRTYTGRESVRSLQYLGGHYGQINATIGKEAQYIDNQLQQCLLNRNKNLYSVTEYIKRLMGCGRIMKRDYVDIYQPIYCGPGSYQSWKLICERFSFHKEQQMSTNNNVEHIMKGETSKYIISDIDCQWKFVPPRGFYLEVSFHTFNILSYQGFCTHNLSVTELDESSAYQHIHTYCGENPP